MWSVTVREEMQTLFRLNIPMMITNLQINALAAVVILLILANNRNSPVCPPENRSFRLLLIHLLILLALDSAMWSVNLQQFPGARILNLIVNYAYYAEQSILGYLWGDVQPSADPPRTDSAGPLVTPAPSCDWTCHTVCQSDDTERICD